MPRFLSNPMAEVLGGHSIIQRMRPAFKEVTNFGQIKL